MGARSLSTQCLCTRHLEEAPVNNTLSDAFQEPAVSNMSVAMETAACLCSASHICVVRAPSFSYQQAAPMAVPWGAAAARGAGPPASPATGAGPSRAPAIPHEAGGQGRPWWGRGCCLAPCCRLLSPVPPHLLLLPIHRAGEQTRPSLFMWRCSRSEQVQSPSSHIAASSLVLGPRRFSREPLNEGEVQFACIVD